MSEVSAARPAEAARVDPPAGDGGAPLTIAEDRIGRRSVLSVVGEVDISSAADLQAAIEATAPRASETWVDLSETTFMDSSGLHAMSRARARLTDANVRLVLVCAGGPVMRVLELTGFDRLFEIHADRRELNS